MKTCSKLFHLLLELISITLFPVFKAQHLEVPHRVSGSLGSNVTLPCQFIPSSEPTFINQVQWDFMQPGGEKITILVFNSQYGVKVSESPLKGRINISAQSLIITGVQKTDEGSYTCKIVTFPHGSLDRTTNLIVVEHNPAENQGPHKPNPAENHEPHLSAEMTAAVITASVVLLVILAVIAYLIFIRRSNSASRLQVLIDTSGRPASVNQPSFIVKEQEVVYSQVKQKQSRDSASSSIVERPKSTRDDVTYSEVNVLSEPQLGLYL